MSLLLWRRF